MSNKFEKDQAKVDHYSSKKVGNDKAHTEEGAPLDQKTQIQYARAAFRLNQYGDGDNHSYDDVGKYGHEEIVRLQEEFNAQKGLGWRIAQRVQRKYTP